MLRRLVRFSLGLAVVFATAVAGALPAFAHETEQPYAYAFVTETAIDGRLELAIGDVGEVLDIDVNGTDTEIEAALRDNGDALRSYAAEHFGIGDGVDAWPIEFGRIDLFRERPGSLAFAVIQYEVEVPESGVVFEPTIRFDPFFEEVEGRDGLLLVSGGWRDGTFAADAEVLQTFSADDRIQTVQLGDDSALDIVGNGIGLGIDHIETGPDHILFVLVLLLPAVLVFTGGAWAPAPGFGASLWRVLKIATFFTIAHSITFTLAGMGWLPLPPSKLTEATIAASIAAAGLHNLRPVFPNKEWLIAFVFGLFHGMGFAGLVAGLETSQAAQLLSLLGRNIGIEIGQVVVILVLFPALFMLRRTKYFQPFFTVGSLLMIVLAIGWMIERLFETDLGTNGVVDAFASTPNGYWVAAALTIVCAGLFMRERAAGALIPVAGDQTPVAESVSATG